MGGLAKGLAILEAFDRENTQLTVSAAARASGTTPAAARRCLLTLVEAGYLSHDGKYFRPTPRVVRLTSAYWSTSTLPTLAQPCLVAVRDELGESASLAVDDGVDSLFLARAESTRIVSAGVRVGATLPLWASATGRVLLAAMPSARVADILERSERFPTTTATIVDNDALLHRIRQARECGYAHTDEELEVGVRTIAVPVIDSSSTVRAAMSVSCFAAQVSMEQLTGPFLDVLRRESARLGKML
ncbi:MULTISPECIES: IclR family transcriptional regulator C-terminal domain-containing protein [unclassified Gordonia (in: high G+C Gram-positive bacteria)]|uniref:IclR family transcriptional regulator domain-containing protein n=1 Tax=unclassified Gordonia (in: high G+C Gram-positive bacteria) TaxID=2657482 RepID=UPI0009AD52C8|nr:MULTISPECIES: IclR family transcriptional regulator C-terminal domain-containing protein [unclassified Gordonia (in: high G+C Gram-positive bacteria)]MDF3282984.1 IclR family transcriptional regulator C-terminal domain-containing protein [Gordonia sp. N1V]OPX10772.1 IclR family transcriptional regulator [Gordonia sp. i37]